MSKPIYQIDDRSLLTDLLGGAGFLGPSAVLQGLTPEQAYAKPHGLPHSIADLVAHMWFWQDWFNGCAVNGFKGQPERADLGWPSPPDHGWDELRDRYLACIEETKRIIATSEVLAERLLPEGIPLPFLERESRASGLLHATVHNGHHLGQIITIRQLLGAWPPPAGSMTW